MSPRRKPLTRTAVTAVAAALAVGCSGTDPASLGSSTGASTSRIATPSGQFVVQGVILHKYNETGGPTGPLGAPISNEQSGPNGGQYSKFQTGVIYWSPRTGAHVLSGEIRLAWLNHGGAEGPLGYPASDQHTVAGGWQAEFEHGTITYTDGQPHITIYQ